MSEAVINQKQNIKEFDRRLLILYLAGFVLALSISVVSYINSSFIENFVSLELVGLFFVAANISSFFAMLYFPWLIKTFNNLMTSKLMMLINITATGLLVVLNSPYLIFLFFILMWVSANLLLINMDMFVEGFTDNTNTGRIRTIFFTAMNLGWVITPSIAANLVVAGDNYRLVYLASAIFLVIFYFIINKHRHLLNRQDIVYCKPAIKKTFKAFWQKANLRGVYIISFFLNLFFGLAVIYMPIYLHNYLGFSWSTIGIIFSIMLVPFVLVEIPAGYLADKYLGEIEMMNIGFIILTLSLLAFFFVGAANPIVWTIILFFSRIGAALIEAMRESRFFKLVDVEQLGQINFLRTSFPLGFLTAAGLGALIVNFYPVNYIFLFSAVLFLISFYFINTIKDSR